MSYASEHRARVEPVAIALRNRGHKVFFDTTDLPAGGAYEERIASAIGQSDLFIFMMTPESLSAGRYTLSELEHARLRWPAPKDRIIAVKLAETPRDLIPAYLGGVTWLEPKGSLAADTCLAVDRLRKPAWPKALAAVLVVVALAGAAGGAWWFLGRGPALKVTTTSVEAGSPGLFGAAGTVRVGVEARGEALASGASYNARVRLADGSTTPAAIVKESHLEAGPTENAAQIVRLSLEIERPDTAEHVEICFVIDPAEYCSEATEIPAGDTSLIPIAGEVRRAARKVARYRDGSLIVLGDRPAAVVRAEGLAEDVGDLGVMQAYAARDRIEAIARDGSIDIVTAGVLPARRLDIPNAQDAFGSPVSRTVRQMVFDSFGTLIVLTGEGDGEPGVYFLPNGAQDALSEPVWANDARFDAKDWRLSSSLSLTMGAWVTATNSVPSSVWYLLPSGSIQFRGHDFELVSCAKDLGRIAFGEPKSSAVVDCEDGVSLIEFDAPTGSPSVRRIKRVAALPVAPEGDVFDDQIFATSGKRLFLAQSFFERTTRGGPVLARLMEVGVDGTITTLMEIPGAAVVSFAAGEDVLAATLQSVSQKSDLVAFRISAP